MVDQGQTPETSVESQGNFPWTVDKISIQVLGKPSQEVITNSQEAISRTLNEMGFLGQAPNVIVSDGEVVSEKTGEPFIACYDWEAKIPTIRIGQAGLKKMWNELALEIPDEISIIIAASEETVHYVQDQQGRLPHTGNKDSIDHSDRHYADEHELEARLISFKVTNGMLGYQFITPKDSKGE